MQGAMCLWDEYDEHIAMLDMLGDGATIRDGHLGGELSRGREDVGEGIEEPVREAARAKQLIGEAPTVEQHVLVAEQPLESGLAKMEMRLRRYIDKSKVQIIHHFEEPLADLN